MKPAAQRMSNLAPQFFSSLNEEIAALIADGKNVIRLDIGSPDAAPAAHIVSALKESASRPDVHGYQSHRGTNSLRNAWAAMYKRNYGVELDPDSEIIPLLGTKEGIFNLTTAFVDPGDIVLIPDPGYLTYTQSALFAGGEPFPMPLSPDRNFLPDLGSIPAKVARRAKIMWLNYPNNPTAATAPREFFVEAIEFARQYDLLLCHDAAYTQVTFDDYRAPSLMEIQGAKAVSVEFNSLSKTYNMAGWRTGAVAGNASVLRTLLTLKTQVDSGHFLPIWEASMAALNGDQSWLQERNEVYRQRRDLVIGHLHALGLNAFRPKASLYIWCPIPDGWTSVGFTKALLQEAHVSLTPGTVFGQNGEGYMRISLTSPDDRLEQAMRRLADWMA